MWVFGIVCRKTPRQVREVLDMSKTIGSEVISRRKALSLVGFAAMFGLAASTTVLTVSDAEAQTVGMERRHERRVDRRERRVVRRVVRHERRAVRRAVRHY
jgi:hypothetical protein